MTREARQSRARRFLSGAAGGLLVGLPVGMVVNKAGGSALTAVGLAAAVMTAILVAGAWWSARKAGAGRPRAKNERIQGGR